jgi:hypothetical protein
MRKNKSISIKCAIFDDSVEIYLHPFSSCVSIRVRNYEGEITSYVGIEAFLEMLDKLNKIRPEWIEEMIKRRKEFTKNYKVTSYPKLCSKCKGRGYNKEK